LLYNAWICLLSPYVTTIYGSRVSQVISIRVIQYYSYWQVAIVLEINEKLSDFKNSTFFKHMNNV